jgi:hypothetical protein
MRMWNRFVFICPVAVISNSVVKFEEASMFLRRPFDEHGLSSPKSRCGEGTWKGIVDRGWRIAV